MCLQVSDSSKFSSFWLGWAKLGGPEQRNNSVSCRLPQEAVNLSIISETFYFKIFQISFSSCLVPRWNWSVSPVTVVRLVTSRWNPVRFLREAGSPRGAHSSTGNLWKSLLTYCFLLTAMESQSTWASAFLRRGNTAIERNCCLGELCQSCVCESQYLFPSFTSTTVLLLWLWRENWYLLSKVWFSWCTCGVVKPSAKAFSLGSFAVVA